MTKTKKGDKQNKRLQVTESTQMQKISDTSDDFDNEDKMDLDEPQVQEIPKGRQSLTVRKINSQVLGKITSVKRPAKQKRSIKSGLKEFIEMKKNQNKCLVEESDDDKEDDEEDKEDNNEMEDKEDEESKGDEEDEEEESTSVQKSPKDAHTSKSKLSLKNIKDEQRSIVLSEEETRRKQFYMTQLFVTNFPDDITTDELKTVSKDVISCFIYGNKIKYAFLYFDSKEKAEENLTLLQDKEFKGNKLCVKTRGIYQGFLYLKTFLLQNIPYDVEVHEVAQHFPKCCKVEINKMHRNAKIHFSEDSDASESFLQTKSIKIRGLEVFVLHYQSYHPSHKSIDGPDAGGRFKEEFNNRGGFRGRFGGSPSFRGGIQGHIGFRGGRGGFGRGLISRGNGFRAAVLGGGRGFSARGRGFRGAERGSGRGVQKRYFN